MARIVLSTMGSLGDLHPMVALAKELKKRGHEPVINTWDGYAEKIAELGFEFRPLRPNVDNNDHNLHRRAMDAQNGPQVVINEIILPGIRDMYDDMVAVTSDADLMITGEIVYAASSVVATTGIKWISTSLAPLSMFSACDPNVYPVAKWLEFLRPLPVEFHQLTLKLAKWTIRDWYEPYRKFRRELRLNEDHDPIFHEKFSTLLHLAMFSTALGKPQPDWHWPTLQTGFCFYDESESGDLDPRLKQFLDSGERPIVFTLGSAAVRDARDFFDESVKAAKLLNRRAILLYGRENEPPKGLTDDIVAFDYAPYSHVFSQAACVVHQAGVGTTAQVLRAGVPHLMMPYSHDQPDNAARCRRAGVAEIIDRDDYTAERATKMLAEILADPKYLAAARSLRLIMVSEDGVKTACNAIDEILHK